MAVRRVGNVQIKQGGSNRIIDISVGQDPVAVYYLNLSTNMVDRPLGCSGGTYYIEIVSRYGENDVPFVISSSPWLSCSTSGNTITVQVGYNSGAIRQGHIKVTQIGGGSETLNITQAACGVTYTFSTSNEYREVEAEGTTLSTNITSTSSQGSLPYSVMQGSVPEWITATNTTLIISPNEGGGRTATIIFKQDTTGSTLGITVHQKGEVLDYTFSTNPDNITLNCDGEEQVLEIESTGVGMSGTTQEIPFDIKTELPDWLTVNITGQSIRVTASKNDDVLGVNRSSVITLQQDESEEDLTVTVTQSECKEEVFIEVDDIRDTDQFINGTTLPNTDVKIQMQDAVESIIVTSDANGAFTHKIVENILGGETIEFQAINLSSTQEGIILTVEVEYDYSSFYFDDSSILNIANVKVYENPPYDFIGYISLKIGNPKNMFWDSGTPTLFGDSYYYQLIGGVSTVHSDNNYVTFKIGGSMVFEEDPSWLTTKELSFSAQTPLDEDPIEVNFSLERLIYVLDIGILKVGLFAARQASPQIQVRTEEEGTLSTSTDRFIIEIVERKGNGSEKYNGRLTIVEMMNGEVLSIQENEKTINKTLKQSEVDRFSMRTNSVKSHNKFTRALDEFKYTLFTGGSTPYEEVISEVDVLRPVMGHSTVSSITRLRVMQGR